MKIEKDRMIWGERLPFIASYVADEMHISDLNISVKIMGIRNPIPYEYTFTVNDVKVSMYFRSEHAGVCNLYVKSPESVGFMCDTFGEVVDNIRWLAGCEEEEAG